MSRALGSMFPSGRRAWAATNMAVAVTSAVLLSGCTGQRAAEAPPTTAPATPTTPTASPATPATPTEPAQIEFEFRQPDPVCPPVSALETLPLADQDPYELVRSSSYSDTDVERFGHFWTLCSYQRAEIGEGGDDMILEDHARISAQVNLYRRRDDPLNTNLGLSNRPLPVQSVDLDDWRVAAGFDREMVWWEGCGEEGPCAEGEQPTTGTRAWQVVFKGHVGNLEFLDVTVSYIAQRLPADVELRTIEIFRDFALAAMDGYEPAE